MKSTDIKGYRELNETDVELINDIKDLEVEVGALWRDISNTPGVDKRWLAIAKTHFQEGFSSFVRAIAQPEDVF